ncbi:MAG: hypothetical protein IT288_04575 [Bdellovibrionales bacterium]|nr:hypothetical protein [Bdellovibrionales bacterium]
MKKIFTFVGLMFCLVAHANPILPTGACTPDVNKYGVPYLCECPTGTTYDSTQGLCFLSQTSPKECTPDMSQWGVPSACACEDGYFYQPKVGLCAHNN